MHKIVVSSIESSSSESIKISDPSILVKPLSYTTTGTYNSPIIRVKNYSEIDIEYEFSKVFFLDSYNHPIYWEYLFLEESESISSNSTRRFVVSGFYYSGTRYKIHVFINVGY